RTLQGKGVSYCAVCDAAFFREKEVVVVGGGDSAMEEAVFLAKFANKVTLVHRRDEFRASSIMIDRARANEKIEFVTPTVVDEVLAHDGQTSAVRLRDLSTDETREIQAQGLFVAIGHDPNTKLFLDQLDPTRQELHDALPSDIHELALEQLLRPAFHDDEPRPRLEGHDHYVYGVFLVPICIREEDEIFYQEIDLIATRERLVTVRKTPDKRHAFDIKAVQDSVAKGQDERVGMIVYRLVDQIAEYFLDLVDAIDEEIDELEDGIEIWR